MKKSTAFILQIYLASFLAGITFGQQSTKTTSLNCASKGKCNECIQTHGCAWCADSNFKNRRCLNAAETAKCDSQFIINPKIDTLAFNATPLSQVNSGTPKSDKSSKSTSGSTSQPNIVQVMPQRLDIALRPNEGNPYRFKVAYRRAEDYPVDLYYLMDLSASMYDDKQKLSDLGSMLATEMRKLTRNFRLGFGSFVDKVVMPYVDISPTKLKAPCNGCVAPYSFKHAMKLNQDEKNFATQVNSSKISGNKDEPEGGFDALMQAIVCKDQIGWRADARKLVIFSTDASFHYAGDGKLAGIVKPNDGQCHLNSKGEYTHFAIQDYPSISHINAKVKEHGINVIFAVTENHIALYKELAKHVEGSSAGQLRDDSSNVVDLVVNEYKKITSVIEMKEKGKGEHFRLKYFSRCLNKNGTLIETNKCEELKVGETVVFEVELELLSCPPSQSTALDQFYIYPVGIEENLMINVTLMCDCKCQNRGPNFYEKKSPKCSGHGTFKCGVCECDSEYSGEYCSCRSDEDKTDKCHPANTTTLCSGLGTCKCNKCECEAYDSGDRRYGQYCECNNFDCLIVDGKKCSGRGECDCGKCKCNPGWIGEGCACQDSTSECLPPDSTDPNDICSGHGTCVCNKCECQKEGGYSGTYCNKCPTCKTKCSELKNCVQCKVHQSGPLSKEDCDVKCAYNITAVDYLEDADSICRYRDEHDCEFIYTYEVTGKHISVLAQKNITCLPPAPVLGVIFSLILGIVLIGLALLLLWKFVTSIKDRREYAKFKKESEEAKWNSAQNPIFKQATSTFKNPTYSGT